jgi:3-methylcrotonyl-CoA carboxylase alpha subunit
MFKKILIANRGEIAVRILRSCREMGIRAVAIYSDADQHALHVRRADEAMPVGPAPAAQSYLNVERIIQAALQSGAQAIHPGYGFLSENATFARAVRDAGLIFIGPSPEAILAMGNKAEARERMQAAHIPVVPGFQGPDDLDALHRAAATIGYPVLIKAAAGGGGKGMRVVPEPAAFNEAAAAARREAQHAFGDSRLILEHYVPNAHHVEFQVLADLHGNVIHLYERECSVQRRHQKILEESPSPLLEKGPAGNLRAAMGRAAVAAAAAVGYQNAGTVEFIVDPRSGEFYFLEMNTRLQVEHPVTELVTGLDIVQWQIRIAAGERLPLKQEDIGQRGHAIECRLYAEDPANNFLPATGRLLRYVEPGGPGVRVDSGVSTGDEISIHYDPMIAKVIACAENRQAAIRKMQTTLQETVLLGLTTNCQFLQDVLADPDFLAGNVYTTWVEEHYGDWRPRECNLLPEVLAAAALTQYLTPEGGQTPAAGRDPFSPWRNVNGFRMGAG